MKKVSIIVPAYNDEKYIGRCLESLISQSMKEIEIICINDGSADSTADIIKHYARDDSRIALFENTENKGQLYSRIVGVKASEGEYISFCDSDDTLREDAIQSMYDLAVTSNADIIHFDINVVSNNFFVKQSMEELISPTPIRLEGESILDNHFVVRGAGTNLIAKLYKADYCKNAISRIPIVEKMLLEDVYASFFLDYYARSYEGRCGEKYKIYNYHIDDGESATKFTEISSYKRYLNALDGLEKVEQFLATNETSELTKRAYEAMRQRVLDTIIFHTEKLGPEDLTEGLEYLAKEIIKHTTLNNIFIERACMKIIELQGVLLDTQKDLRKIKKKYRKLENEGILSRIKRKIRRRK